MISGNQIRPHMAVVDSGSQQFALVDHMEGSDTIKLTKGNSDHHHYIPLAWVASVDDKVHLDRPVIDVVDAWSFDPPRH